MAVKKSPKLIVVFDTNALFTQAASDLVKSSLSNLILENSDHTDLDIEWNLPNIVVGERRFQMLSKAKELLPNLNKLEKLVGHQFGVGEDTLELHVENAIKKGIEECGFKVADVDTDSVEWKDVINRSVNRQPPFEIGEKEKGFRDAIIGQSFLQLHNNSPVTPNVCRLALVTDDQKLKDYVEEKTVESKNVRLLDNLEELENLINTIVSTIPEELAVELADKAARLFFQKEDQKSFYYKNNIRQRISEQYSEELSRVYSTEQHRSDDTWWIPRPVFLKKKRQRIYWSSTIEADFELYRLEFEAPKPKTIADLASLESSQVLQGGLLGLGDNTQISKQGLLATGLAGGLGATRRISEFTGKEKFEVHWSTNLTAAKNLTAPKLEKIEYIGNDYSENGT